MILRGVLRTAKLGVGLARQEAKDTIARAVRQAALAVVVLSFLLLAFGFALGAFAVWLSREIGTVHALGFIALGFVILAAILYGISRTGGDRKPKSAREQLADSLAESDESEESQPGSTVASLAVVALVGFTLARQLFRR
ncbi:MAG: phage holin family protein [Hyphomicrobiales bacterium]|nr:phage holin family protein [Hyphomicrobiales bacterium]